VTDLAAFLGLCVLITITPGLDTTVVIRTTLRRGRGAGLCTAVGCAGGLFIHATVVAAGMAQLLLRSATVFEIVKLAGVVMLVVLGGRALWSARSGRGVPTHVGSPEAPAPRSHASPFAQGLLTNLANPKATLFFVATLPQFVPADHPTQAIPVALGLAGVAVLFSLTGLGVTALAVHRIRNVLKSRRARRIQDAVLGATLLALAVRVATE
jgi:threonine/homoserine/homoserine lactone efflux protein